jgi:hypothetical protein
MKGSSSEKDLMEQYVSKRSELEEKVGAGKLSETKMKKQLDRFADELSKQGKSKNWKQLIKAEEAAGGSGASRAKKRKAGKESDGDGESGRPETKRKTSLISVTHAEVKTAINVFQENRCDHFIASLFASTTPQNNQHCLKLSQYP